MDVQYVKCLFSKNDRILLQELVQDHGQECEPVGLLVKRIPKFFSQGNRAPDILVRPHGLHEDLPYFTIRHHLPHDITLAAPPSGLPEIPLQNRKCFRCPDQADRKAYLINKGHKEIQHLFRTAAFPHAQVLDFVNYKDTKAMRACCLYHHEEQRVKRT